MFFLLFTLSFAVAENENPKCKVPGEPLRWGLGYCMLLEGTDDVESVGNTACGKSVYAEFNDPSKKDPCAKNLAWKTKFCALMLKKNLAGERKKWKTAEKCANDPSFFPADIKNGF